MGAYGILVTSNSLENNTVAQVRYHMDLIKSNVDHLLVQTCSDLCRGSGMGSSITEDEVAMTPEQAQPPYDLLYPQNCNKTVEYPVTRVYISMLEAAGFAGTIRGPSEVVTGSVGAETPGNLVFSD